MTTTPQLSRVVQLPYGYTNPLQIVWWSGTRKSIAFGGTSGRVDITGYVVAEIAATENCYIRFGGASVDADASIASNASRLFLSGVQVIPIPIDPATNQPYTHIAAIQQNTAGILQIEKVE